MTELTLSTDPDREKRIRFAAQLQHQTLSAFILEAAGDRAEQVIASASATVVSEDFFDQLWQALDEAPNPNSSLARRAAADRRVEQR